MTSQKHPKRRPDGRSSIRGAATIAIVGCSLAFSAFLSGCGEDPPPPPPPVVNSQPVAPPPPPPPPPPSYTPISELMVTYNIDNRVQLSEDTAPKNDDQRIALLLFYDAFARGDSSRLAGMLDSADQIQLEAMTKSGEFKAATDEIFAIDVRTGMSPMGDNATLGLFMVGDEFQPTLWTYTVMEGSTSGGSFKSESTPPNMIDRLSGDDWITAWYTILGLEIARASEMDEEIEIPTQDFTEEDDSAGGSPGGPGGPGGGGGAPGKRKRDPSKPKVNPNRGPGGPGGN